MLPWKRVDGRPRWKRFDGRLGGEASTEGPCGVLWPLSMEDLEGRVSKEGIAKEGASMESLDGSALTKGISEEIRWTDSIDGSR